MRPASAPSTVESPPATAVPRTTQALIHALNNQLTVVLGAAEWACECGDPELMKNALALIARSSGEMARLLREFPRDPEDPTARKENDR